MIGFRMFPHCFGLNANIAKIIFFVVWIIKLEQAFGTYHNDTDAACASACKKMLQVTCTDVAIITSMLRRNNHKVVHDSSEARACLQPLIQQMTIPESRGANLAMTTYGGTLHALSDLMIFWGCDVVLLILDVSQGISPSLASDFFRSRGHLVDIRLVLDNNVNDDLTSAIVNYRYVMLLSNSGTCERVLSASALHPELFDRMHNWVAVLSEPSMRSLRFEHFSKMISHPFAQLAILVPAQSQKFTGDRPDSPSGKINVLEIEDASLTIFRKVEKFYSTTMTNRSTYFLDLPIRDKTNMFHSFATNADVYDVFRSPQTGETEFIRFASWGARRGIRLLSLAEANLTRMMLKQRRLRVVPFPLVPYTILDQSRAKIEGGYLPEIFFSIGKHLNLKYDIHFTNDSTFGIETNGSFSGFVGRIQRGEDDMAFSVLSLLQTRKRVLHYGQMVSRGYVTMCMPRPDSKVPPTIYVMPFSPAVWLCMLPALLCLMAALVIITVASPSGGDLRQHIRKPATFFHWLFSGEFLERAFESPPGWAGKAVFYTLLSATLVTFTYYSSILTSLLTYREQRLPFNTLEEMVVNKNYKVLLVKQSMYQTIFEKAKDDVFKKVWQKVVREGRKGLVQGFTEGYFHMLTGKYVYITDGPSTQYLARSNCRVAFTNAKYMKEYYHVGIGKTFPYGRLFNNDLYRLIEGGIIQRLDIMYLRSHQEACKQSTETKQLELDQVIPLFLFLAIAIAMSILTLLGEICVDTKQRARSV